MSGFITCDESLPTGDEAKQLAMAFALMVSRFSSAGFEIERVQIHIKRRRKPRLARRVLDSVLRFLDRWLGIR